MRYIPHSPANRAQELISRMIRDAWERLLDLDLATVLVFTAVIFVLWVYSVRMLVRRRAPREAA